MQSEKGFRRTARNIKLFGPLIAGALSLIALPSLAQIQFQRACHSIHQPLPVEFRSPSIGSNRADFRHEKEMDKEVRPVSEVENQCALGVCHLFAWKSKLENDYHKRTGQTVKLSIHYMIFTYWLKQTFIALRDQKSTVELGATPLTSIDFIGEMGLMPSQSWQGSTVFFLEPYGSRIQEYVQNLLVRVAHFRKNRPTNLNDADIVKLAQKQIIEAFKDMIGSHLGSFNYLGKELTPTTFASEILGESKAPLIQLTSLPLPLPETSTPVGKHFVVTSNVKTLAKTARQLLDSGETILLGYEHNGAYVDYANGVMSMSAFNMPADFMPVNRSLRLQYEIQKGGHAVELVGYDADPTTNEITKWKIKNSWGTRVGDQGYFYMYADYFNEFATSLTFRQPLWFHLPPQPPAPAQLEFDFSRN